MEDKKKLITLLCQFSLKQEWILSVANLAEFLLANGVTFAKWEPIGDVPPKGECLAYSSECREMMMGYVCGSLASWTGYCCESNDDVMFNVTHWMPKPMPPKEEADA